MKQAAFIILTALTILSASRAEILRDKNNTDSELLAQNSDYWPRAVSILKTIDQDDVSGNRKKIKAGQEGILQRLEEGRLLIDFGRHGVHWMLPDATDFFTRVREVYSGQRSKEFPNFSGQILSRLVFFPKQQNKHISMEDHLPKKGYIVVYPGTYSRDNIRVIDCLDDLVSEYSEIQFFTLQTDMRWQQHFMSKVNALPIFLPHLAEGYTKAFHHEPKEQPSFVAVDQNGKVLYRSETLSTNPVSAQVRIMTRRGQKRKANSIILAEIRKAVESLIQENN